MTREEARKIVEMFEFIKAYAEGKEIEVKQDDGDWWIIYFPDFTSEVERYRVYEPTYRPFKNGYECMNAILKHGKEIVHRTTDIKVTISSIDECGIEVCGTYVRYANAFRDYKFIDGCTFGIKDE